MHPKEFIEKYGITGLQLADFLGVNPTTVYHWIAPNSDRQPTQQILNYLDLTDAWLQTIRIIPPQVKNLSDIIDSQD